MALYPNGRYLTQCGGRMFGPGAGLESRTQAFNTMNARFTCVTFNRTASTPDGYDVNSVVKPIRAGGMSAFRPMLEYAGLANLLSGAPMIGSGTIAWASNSNLSLVVSLSGTTALVTLTAGAAQLRLTIALDGTGAFAFTGAGGLSMIVPISGAGAVSFDGAADLRGRLAMDGSWSPFTALSPEGLASAVWGAIAASNNSAGTMGAKLNTASSGGVDLNALAVAVWSYATRTLTGSAGGLTIEQDQRLRELFEIHGLDATKPLQVTQSNRTAGSINQAVADVNGATTVTRI